MRIIPEVGVESGLNSGVAIWVPGLIVPASISFCRVAVERGITFPSDPFTIIFCTVFGGEGLGRESVGVCEFVGIFGATGATSGVIESNLNFLFCRCLWCFESVSDVFK